MARQIAAIVLAAGRGTRMKSSLPKVLHKLHSRPLLSFVIKALKEAGVSKTIIVVGHKDDAVKKAFPDIVSVTQTKLLGSGDAVKRARAPLLKFRGDILVLYGDTPFIKSTTIKKIIKKHQSDKASCTILSAKLADPSGYGRILRDERGNIVKIIEENDASFYEKEIDEINVGSYAFDKKDLFSFLDGLKINKKKREYYLTDIIELFTKNKKKVSSLLCDDITEGLGINSRVELSNANNIFRKRVLENLMLNGVTIVDPDSTFIDMDVKIGKDTIINPHTVIEKNVSIGKRCEIGPFANLRSGTVIDDNVGIGNFVELVRTKVSSGTKIKHMAYLGDTVVGKNVNIGAGTITANYDGKNKNKTVIEDNAFIGVGSILIAPVKIGRRAVVGAGTLVPKNHNVPSSETVVGIPARILVRRKIDRRRPYA